MNNPVLYMIPCPIWDDEIKTIPSATVDIIHNLEYFIVEKAKTARHFLKAVKHPISIQNLTIIEMTRDGIEKAEFRKWISEGFSAGVISEAGCPGIADPGTHLVALAHQLKIKVKPCTGPNSIILALMASGFNGQQFTFHGYLPNKKNELSRKLRQLEQSVQKGHGTQIFIETPYRNQFLIKECIQILSPSTLLSVASQISGPDERIMTQKIDDWKKTDLSIVKKFPCIYSIGTMT